jgi:hypothetical protein
MKVLVVLLGLTIGCGSMEAKVAGTGGTPGIGGAPGTGGTPGTGGLMGTGGAPVDPAARFVGTWQVVSGTTTFTCNNGATETNPVTSSDVFAKGVSSDLVQTGDCPIRYSISGNTATAAAGQSCTDNASGLTLQLSALTFTTLDGLNGTEAGSGHIMGLVDSTTGAPLTCPFSENATYQKIAN